MVGITDNFSYYFLFIIISYSLNFHFYVKPCNFIGNQYSTKFWGLPVNGKTSEHPHIYLIKTSSQNAPSDHILRQN